MKGSLGPSWKPCCDLLGASGGLLLNSCLLALGSMFAPPRGESRFRRGQADVKQLIFSPRCSGGGGRGREEKAMEGNLKEDSFLFEMRQALPLLRGLNLRLHPDAPRRP